jgi:putative ATP-dependent endonuclease of OLD family
VYIRRLVIRNFRALRLLDVRVQPGLTCIIGENNTGKTSILHALRLLLDSSIPNTWRQLVAEDFSSGVDITQPQQIVVAVEFTGYKDRAESEALVFDWAVDDDVAAICYRFRPKDIVRDALKAGTRSAGTLTIADYGWQMAAIKGLDPAKLKWDDELGVSVRFDRLASFHIAHLFALRDVEEDLRRSRVSPLGQLLDAADIPETDKAVLVGHVKAANAEIAKDANIDRIGTAITDSFKRTVGSAFTMSVDVGVADPSFAALARSLRVLLTDKGLTDAEPSRNGLGLNNVLYISMLLEAFRQQIQKGNLAGQLLLVEEPESHLHPELQRILFSRLLKSQTQTIATTHSTHITSKAPLENLLVLTNTGTPATGSVVPKEGCRISAAEVADLERYLDATRSTLLFARRVLLVEGMSEVFVIPALVKHLMKFDFEEAGIAVVPIHGNHFASYAKLFCRGGIEKRCAVLTDGDLKPRDGSDDGTEKDDETDGGEEENAGAASSNVLAALKGLENEYLQVFDCDSTFERELALHGNLKMFAAAAERVGAPRTAKFLSGLAGQSTLTPEEAETAKRRVLSAANRFGKARFAQVASEFVDTATVMPDYITRAVEWLSG